MLGVNVVHIVLFSRQLGLRNNWIKPRLAIDVYVQYMNMQNVVICLVGGMPNEVCSCLSNAYSLYHTANVYVYPYTYCPYSHL